MTQALEIENHEVLLTSSMYKVDQSTDLKKEDIKETNKAEEGLCNGCVSRRETLITILLKGFPNVLSVGFKYINELMVYM